MNLFEIFQEQVNARPDADAIIESRHGRVRVTRFAALEDGSARAAAQLQGQGLQPGAVVLIFLPMSAELYQVVLGVLRLGMTAMFLDPSATADEIEAACSLVPPRALVAVSKAHALRLKSRALGGIPLKFSVGWPVPGAVRWSDSLPPCLEMRDCEGPAPALITFTSGTTGQPKAVVRTHEFLQAQHRVLERVLSLRPGQVDLTTLPIFLLANLASGVTSVLPDADLRNPGRITPNPVLSQLREHQVTRCAASPALFERLLSGTGAMSGLRHIYTGGAPVFPHVLDELRKAAPDSSVQAVYGSTEAEPIALLDVRDISPEDRIAMGKGKGLLAGNPVKEIALRIMPESWGRPMQGTSAAEFDQRALQPDEPGEILVSGAHVLERYWQGKGDEETKVHAGTRVWHRTGDAGFLDDQHRLWLLGRCSARVRDARGTLWPLAVETAAMQHAPLRRAALFTQHGRRVLALEPNSEGGPDPARQIMARLDWAGLDECRAVKQIPVDRRHNAKVDYRALAALLE